MMTPQDLLIWHAGIAKKARDRIETLQAQRFNLLKNHNLHVQEARALFHEGCVRVLEGLIKDRTQLAIEHVSMKHCRHGVPYTTFWGKHLTCNECLPNGQYPTNPTELESLELKLRGIHPFGAVVRDHVV